MMNGGIRFAIPPYIRPREDSMTTARMFAATLAAVFAVTAGTKSSRLAACAMARASRFK